MASTWIRCLLISGALLGGAAAADSHRPAIGMGSGPERNIVDTGSTSLAVAANGADGLPVIAYYERRGNDLAVARCGDPACASVTSIRRVDTAGNKGIAPAMAIGPDGLPFIIHWEGGATTADWKLWAVKCGDASCSQGNSIREIAPDDDLPGYWSVSVAVGPDNLPIFTTINVVRDIQLNAYFCMDSRCSSTDRVQLDPIADGSGTTALRLSSEGFPVVAYFGSKGLNVLACGSRNCSTDNSITSVDSSTGLDFAAALDLDADGRPVMAYCDMDSGLTLARCSERDCARMTAVRLGSCTRSTGISLELSAGGLPVVACDKQAKLVLACRQADCSGEVDTSTWSATGLLDGRAGAMVLGMDGLPFLVYRDVGNGDLVAVKYITTGNPVRSFAPSERFPPLETSHGNMRLFRRGKERVFRADGRARGGPPWVSGKSF